MAKGTDSEEFVVMSESESRSGLKRELAFVLEVQSELPDSLGRTRSSNFGNGPSSHGILEYSRKRFRKSGANDVHKSFPLNDSVEHEDAPKNIKDKLLIVDESETGLLKNPNLAENNINAANAPMLEELTNNLVSPSLLEDKNNSSNAPNAPVVDDLSSNLVSPMSNKEVLNGPCKVEAHNGLMAYPSEVDPENNVEKVVGEQVPSRRRFTRSALKSEDQPLVYDEYTIKGANNVDEDHPRGVIVCCLESPNVTGGTGGLLKSATKKYQKQIMQSTSKQKAENMLIDDTGKVHKCLTEKPLYQYTLVDSELKVPTERSNSKEAHMGNLRQSLSSDFQLENKIELPLVNTNNNSQDAPKVGDPKNNEISRGPGTITVPIVIGDYNEAHDVPADKTPRRFTRSALNCASQPVTIDGTREVQNALESNTEVMMIDDNDGLQNPLPDTPQRQFSCTALVPMTEHMMVENIRESAGTSAIKPLRRFTRSALVCKTEPQGMDERSKAQHALLETQLRQFTRSALVGKTESLAMDGNSEAQNGFSEKPMRRFTRSTLKVKEEPAGILTASTSCGIYATSGDHKNEGTTNTCKSIDVISPVRTPNKKLEMKMSKKIALAKNPTKISELLETGMLEGLSIKYMCRAQQDGVLRGTIKDSGILCLCTFCKGCKVVTPYQFERHAGSANRNPAYYLYLDNGNSLRDVLNACKDAPLDMLEETIQTAIKSSSLKSAVCLDCKRPLFSKIRRTLILCNSCLDLKKSQASPVCTVRSVTRLKTPATPKEVGASKCISPLNNSSRGKLTRKDLGLHKLVFEKDGLPDGTELAYYVRGQKLLEGYKKGLGIFCFCCSSEISPSQFEAHAGWATRRKPYLHIYTSNGVSLHELSISLSKGRKFSAKDNDDLCGICANFGDLLLCDGCPRAFHKECVGELSVPRGKWFCQYCQNVRKDQSFTNNANAVAAGRVSGVDPIEEISKRCIRIVKTPETEVGGCTLCRIPGFSKSHFGPRTIILCDQCEKEFHVGCLRDHNMGDLKELPKGKWFCCRDCSRINSALQKCILRGPEQLPDSLTNLIKIKQENSKHDISWRLLNGKLASPENRSLLSKAVAIFHNRFDPIVDAVTGRDLIPCMVYGRNIRDQDFGGMFCAVLTVNSSVVSAGLLRIFGQELAELPLVATSIDHQGQGYFQSLFSCIERLLGFLNVKDLVLPAAEEAEAIWTEKFGFQKINPDQMTKYTKDYQMTVFRETPVLHKLVPKCRIKRARGDS